MSETVSVTIPHRLTKAEARRRLDEGFQRVAGEMVGKAVTVDQTWTGDHLDFSARVMGQTISGRLDVEDTAVQLEVDLPRLLASMATMFKGRLRQGATKLLEKK